MREKWFELHDETTQIAMGAALAKACDNRACLIFLQGDLGAGKTTLVRGFLRGLGYTGKVKSPTYTLIEPYEINNKQILHVDLYRLQNSDEIDNLGLQDLLTSNTQCLIEWPEKAIEKLPNADLTCYIAPYATDTGRRCRVVASTQRGEEILAAMVKAWKE